MNEQSKIRHSARPATLAAALLFLLAFHGLDERQAFARTQVESPAADNAEIRAGREAIKARWTGYN